MSAWCHETSFPYQTRKSSALQITSNATNAEMHAFAIFLLALLATCVGTTLAHEDTVSPGLRQNAFRDDRIKKSNPATITTTTIWVTKTIGPNFVNHSAWPPVLQNNTRPYCSKSIANVSIYGYNPASSTKSSVHSYSNTTSTSPTTDAVLKSSIIHTINPTSLPSNSRSISTTTVTLSRLPDSILSTTSSSTTALSSPVAPSAGNSSTSCQRPKHPTNYTSIGPWYGLNVVNSRPGPNQHSLGPKSDTTDWEAAFKIVKNLLPYINAVRLYSTMDWNGTSPEWLYLENALLAAKEYGLKILAGVWSGGLGADNQARFSAERDALANALQMHGCSDIVAVSVGNEDLNNVNEMTSLSPAQVATTKQQTVDLLIQQINETRAVLDQFGCCNVPVTHTDTWNEIFNDTVASPWVSEVSTTVCD